MDMVIVGDDFMYRIHMYHIMLNKIIMDKYYPVIIRSR